MSHTLSAKGIFRRPPAGPASLSPSETTRKMFCGTSSCRSAPPSLGAHPFEPLAVHSRSSNLKYISNPRRRDSRPIHTSVLEMSVDSCSSLRDLRAQAETQTPNPVRRDLLLGRKFVRVEGREAPAFVNMGPPYLVKLPKFLTDFDGLTCIRNCPQGAFRA